MGRRPTDARAAEPPRLEYSSQDRCPMCPHSDRLLRKYAVLIAGIERSRHANLDDHH